MRKVVDDCYDLRTDYRNPVVEERENRASLFEVLQEVSSQKVSAEPSTPKNQLRSTLKKASGIFRPFWKENEDESIIFESHIASPISSPTAPLTPREASPMVGSFPKLRKRESHATSIGSTTFTGTPRSISKQYPPNTPDRPTPLTVVKSRTTTALRSGTDVAVSTPTRSRWVVPLSPDDESPPAPMPAIPSPLQSATFSRSKTAPKFSLIPTQYAREPNNKSPFVAKVDNSATMVGSFTAATTKGPDSRPPVITSPSSNSTADSVDSEPNEPGRAVTFDGKHSIKTRHDTPGEEDTSEVPHRASGCTDTSDDWYTVSDVPQRTSGNTNTSDGWYTIASADSEFDVRDRSGSLYDSTGFLKDGSCPQEDSNLSSPTTEESQDTARQPTYPPRVDSLQWVSRIPRLRKVTPEERAAARQAGKVALDGNRFAMSASDELPLRRFVSTLEVGSPRSGVSLAPTHIPAPNPALASKNEETVDETAAEK